MFMFFIICFNLYLLASVDGHGRMLEPPNRSSLWRLKEFEPKDPPKNYADNELFCGGYDTQYEKNKGKCGLCGDNYADPTPRANEDGGKYGRGIIARKYSPGQVINIKVELTQSHKGFFYFYLCVRNFDKTSKRATPSESEACFKKYNLEIADGKHTGKRFPITTWDTGFYNTKVKLPNGVKGDRSVLLWDYVTGNRWGKCENGTSQTGCGPQEIFRGCADIAIQ